MRLVSLAWTIASVLIMGLAVPAATAGGDSVSKCLESSAYLDGGETYELCDKALKESSLSNETLSAINRQIGEAYYFAQRPGPAIPYLDTAIRLDPKSGQAYRRRGWSQFRLENISAAIADFTEYLALSPDDPDAQFAMAFVRYDHPGDCAGAAKEYERILAQHPDHYMTRRTLAGAYACVDGHPMRKLAELNRILAAGRDAIADVNYFGRRGREDRDFYAVVIEERAGIYYETSETGKAIADYSWLIDNYPRMPFSYVNRGYLRMNILDHVGALADAEMALGLYYDYPDAQYLKVSALIALKRNDETIAFATDVLTRGYVSPRTPTIYLHRAIALKRLGRPSEAAEDLNRAMADGGHQTWVVHTQLAQSGYIFGPTRDRAFDDGGPPLDTQAKEFRNALAACLVDPECLK